jgi:secreted trypsin-like serine protease
MGVTRTATIRATPAVALAAMLLLCFATTAFSKPVAPATPKVSQEIKRHAFVPRFRAPATPTHFVADRRAGQPGRRVGLKPRVVGGTDVSQGQAPFMAFIQDQPPGGNTVFGCSGTVVSPNVILTAGHCTVDPNSWTTQDPAGFTVVTNAADFNDSTSRQLSNVYETIPYPYFDPSDLANDLGLLVLSSPISTPSIAMPTSADQYLELAGTGAGIAGWGETYAGSGATNIMQWAPTVIQGAGYCGQQAAYHPVAAYSSSYNLCAIDAPTDDTSTCHGDSGGPLYRDDAAGQPVELGITSWGDPNCSTTYPNYFTATLPFASWIQQQINAVAPPPPPPPPSTPAGSAGTSAPPASSAPPRLPQLTLSDTRSYVRQTLTGVFGRTFTHRSGYQNSCSRLSRTKVSCNINFWSGPNDYWGYVTIHYLFGQPSKVEWSDNYVLHSVNNHCYYHTNHRSSCRIRTKRGTW